MSHVVEREGKVAGPDGRGRQALRVLAALRGALRAVDDPEEVWRVLCRIAVDEAGYELAWVGVAETDALRRVRPVAHAGRREGAERYVRQLEITWADEPRGRGPTGTAVRERRACTNEDSLANPRFASWRAAATSAGYRSSMAIPFETPDRRVATLNVYAAEPRAFDEDAAALLAQVVLDVEMRLEVLHARSSRLELLASLAAARRELRAVHEVEAPLPVHAAVAHDLRNLLTVVESHVGELARRGGSPAHRAELEELLRVLDRARALSQRLTEPSEGPVGPFEHDLIALLDESLTSLRRAVGDRVRLEVCLPPAPVQVEVDPGTLQRALLNVALNGRDAMNGSGRLRLEVGVAEADASRGAGRGPAAFIAVSDTGGGVAPDDLSRLFEPHFTTKADGRGRGLGLWSVKHGIEAHGGWVEVASEPGHGATFTIYLPLCARRPRAVARGRGETVLVVEDEAAIRWGLSRALRDGGYVVVEAASVADARARASEVGARLGAVLSDFQLPDGSGVALLRELAGARPELGLIGMSGCAPWELTEPGAEPPEGACVLVKPFDLDDMLGMVRATLDERAARPTPAAPGAPASPGR